MNADADLCRTNGWGPGAVLVGDEGFGPTEIEIRYVGEELIVAKELSHDGIPSTRAREVTWTLSCRGWREVSKT